MKRRRQKQVARAYPFQEDLALQNQFAAAGSNAPDGTVAIPVIVQCDNCFKFRQLPPNAPPVAGVWFCRNLPYTTCDAPESVIVTPQMAERRQELVLAQSDLVGFALDDGGASNAQRSAPPAPPPPPPLPPRVQTSLPSAAASNASPSVVAPSTPSSVSAASPSTPAVAPLSRKPLNSHEREVLRQMLDRWNKPQPTGSAPQTPSASASTGALTASSSAALNISASDIASDERIRCIVCFDFDRSVVLIPCRHMICCLKCGNDTKTCPLCLTLVQERMQVFLS